MGFVEIDRKCQKTLALRFPGVPIYGDIKSFDPAQIPGRIDLIHGGFPCQDISSAGLGAGIEGERSSLWAEFARCICVARPSYALVENVSSLNKRGLDVVLGCLAQGGYDAEWDCISAASVGCLWMDGEEVLTGHGRNRLWTCATLPDTAREREWLEWFRSRGGRAGNSLSDFDQREDNSGYAPDSDSSGCEREEIHIRQRGPLKAETISSGEGSGSDVSDAEGRRDVRRDGFVPDVGILERARLADRLGMFFDASWEWREAQSGIQRVTDRVANRVDRLEQIGNANPPQMVEFLGTLVREDAERRRRVA